MKNHDDIDELLAKHFAHEELTAAQQNQLEMWIEACPEEYKRLQKLIDMPLSSKLPFHVDSERAWAKIEPKLDNNPFKKHLERKKVIYYSVAASIALILATVALYTFHNTEPDTLYYADLTQTETFLLPDSSQVTLYPNASLSFRYASNETERLVELKGKAFFRVKNRENTPFTIKARQLKVEVLGTSFLIDAPHDNKTGVFVESGRVKVSAAHNNVVLEANEKVELIDDQMKLGIIDDPSTFFGKEDSVLVFQNKPITEVVKELERQTGIRIELGKGVEKNSVTTRINAAEKENIATELAFLCGCKCDTIEKGKHYRLYYE